MSKTTRQTFLGRTILNLFSGKKQRTGDTLMVPGCTKEAETSFSIPPVMSWNQRPGSKHKYGGNRQIGGRNHSRATEDLNRGNQHAESNREFIFPSMDKKPSTPNEDGDTDKDDENNRNGLDNKDVIEKYDENANEGREQRHMEKDTLQVGMYEEELNVDGNIDDRNINNNDELCASTPVVTEEDLNIFSNNDIKETEKNVQHYVCTGGIQPENCESELSHIDIQGAEAIAAISEEHKENGEMASSKHGSLNSKYISMADDKTDIFTDAYMNAMYEGENMEKKFNSHTEDSEIGSGTQNSSQNIPTSIVVDKLQSKTNADIHMTKLRTNEGKSHNSMVSSTTCGLLEGARRIQNQSLTSAATVQDDTITVLDSRVTSASQVVKPRKLNDTPAQRLATFKFHPAAMFHAPHSIWTTDRRLLRAMPPPTPPQSTKKEACAGLTFRHIDEKAIKAPKRLLGRQLHFLVQHLTENLDSDIERLRALYTWLTCVVIDKVKFPLKAIIRGTVYDYLRNIQARKINHAQMMALLCSVVHIPCVVVNGFQKGGGYDIEGSVYKRSNYGEWNAVLVDNEWRLLNAFWGFQQNSNVASKSALRVNDNFFIPDPETLLHTHYPAEMNWQLVNNPISRREFESKAFLKERFFELEMQLLSHPQMEIILESGETDITFLLDPSIGKYLRFFCLLHRRCDEGYELIRNSHLHHYDMTYIEYESKLTIKLRFPNKGLYRVEIIGKDVRNTHPLYDFDFVAIYAAVVVMIPTGRRRLFPVCGDAGWGNHPDCEDFGIFPEFYDAYHVTQYPVLTLSYRVSSRDTLSSIIYKVITVDDAIDSVMASEADFDENDLRYHITVKLPPQWDIAVCVFAEMKETSGASPLMNISNYVVYFDPPAPDTPTLSPRG